MNNIENFKNLVARSGNLGYSFILTPVDEDDDDFNSIRAKVGNRGKDYFLEDEWGNDLRCYGEHIVSVEVDLEKNCYIVAWKYYPENVIYQVEVVRGVKISDL